MNIPSKHLANVVIKNRREADKRIAKNLLRILSNFKEHEETSHMENQYFWLLKKYPFVFAEAMTPTMSENNDY